MVSSLFHNWFCIYTKWVILYIIHGQDSLYVFFSLSLQKECNEINGAQLHLTPKAETYIWNTRAFSYQTFLYLPSHDSFFSGQVVYTSFDELHCLMRPRKWSSDGESSLSVQARAVLTGANPDQGRHSGLAPTKLNILRRDEKAAWYSG